MNAWLALTIIVGGLGAAGFIGWTARDGYLWLRAWLYVRFFIRYEMAGCALEAKVREGAK